jgi:hypothetical protein
MPSRPVRGVFRRAGLSVKNTRSIATMQRRSAERWAPGHAAVPEHVVAEVAGVGAGRPRVPLWDQNARSSVLAFPICLLRLTASRGSS